MKLFLVLNRISQSFALLTREISWSTLEINFIFPHIHVLFLIQYITCLPCTFSLVVARDLLEDRCTSLMWSDLCKPITDLTATSRANDVA